MSKGTKISKQNGSFRNFLGGVAPPCPLPALPMLKHHTNSDSSGLQSPDSC